ncbi:hypothetical protein AGLY_002504 [Aphis glycines]|uniref:Uncharacterized protein n=1 Tax=Aphis glycines TaxID=307491 RepID=A0A6G0U0X8_APHGL|nr:hypothetical protein AGLY_002504 [Aphis glycines]
MFLSRVLNIEHLIRSMILESIPNTLMYCSTKNTVYIFTLKSYKNSLMQRKKCSTIKCIMLVPTVFVYQLKVLQFKENATHKNEFFLKNKNVNIIVFSSTTTLGTVNTDFRDLSRDSGDLNPLPFSIRETSSPTRLREYYEKKKILRIFEYINVQKLLLLLFIGNQKGSIKKNILIYYFNILILFVCNIVLHMYVFVQFQSGQAPCSLNFQKIKVYEEFDQNLKNNSQLTLIHRHNIQCAIHNVYVLCHKKLCQWLWRRIDDIREYKNNNNNE